MTTQQNTTYHLKNWSAYSRSLKDRGNVTLWLDSSTISSWETTGYRTYSDLAIEACLKVRAVFCLPLRQTEGFLEGLFASLGLTVPVPDYSTVSRRAAFLEVDVSVLPKGEPIHLVADSTGLKVYGEGEWKVRQHGWCKRRTWIKLHLGVDEGSGQIVAQGVTSSSTHDDTAFPRLLSRITVPVAQASLDGAYDREGSRLALARRGIPAVIPPRKDALLTTLSPSNRGSPSCQAGNQRNLAIHAIARDGYASWAKESGYSRRAAAEWTVSRFKRSFGGTLRSRRPERQQAEAAVKCGLLNDWLTSCRPESYPA